MAISVSTSVMTARATTSSALSLASAVPIIYLSRLSPRLPLELPKFWRNLERAGVPRSVAMKLTGYKTEAVYLRCAIVCEADLTEGFKKLAVLEQSLRGKLELSHSLATISGIPSQRPNITGENMAVEPVFS